MSNILKVSTPVSGYENSSRTNPISTNDPNLNNVTDVTKVTRPDGKTTNTDNQPKNFVLPQNSNFEGFIKILREMPSATAMMKDLLFYQMGNLISSGINESFAEEIASFMDMIKMSPEELEGFLKSQADGNGKFGGQIFDFLRTTLAQSTSNDMNLRIVDMLKKYSDFTANRHVLNSIFIDLGNITARMPARFAEPFLAILQALNPDAGQGEVTKNLDILKNQVIPFLAEYTKNTNDFGRIRDVISSLMLNIARYENGSKANFMDAFTGLLNYTTIKGRLGGIDPEVFAQTLIQMGEEKSEALLVNDKFISILKRGISGEAGYENIETFKGILSALLLNESVYMPLNHIMLPLEIDGNLMFSELWIDPNDESSQGQQEEGECAKLLIKFDIKDVGFFDLVLLHRNGKVDMQIFCPDAVLAADKAIRTGLTDILERNGLRVNSVSVDPMRKPLTISEVFPKIYERKNTVNVKI